MYFVGGITATKRTDLGERPDVFQGEACIAYIPHHTTYEVLTNETGVEIAVCKVPSHSESAAVILEAGEAVDEDETHLRIWENVFSDDSECKYKGCAHDAYRKGNDLPPSVPKCGCVAVSMSRAPRGRHALQLAHNDVSLCQSRIASCC